MERIRRCLLLLFIGNAYCNPYYYRESKQHSEHRREYSYDGSPVHVSPTPGEEASTLQFISKPVPEKYYSSVYPIHSQSFQSQNGGYSFSQGALQQSSVYQSPLTVSSLTATPVVYSQQPYGGNVVVRKVVKVFTYPSTSSQAGNVHFSQFSTGSDVSGSETQGLNVISDSMHGHRIMAEKLGEHLYPKYLPSDKTSSSQTVQRVVTQHSQFSRRGDSFDSESLEGGQKELSEELPYDQNMEVGQREESLVEGQRGENLYLGQQSLDLGQQEEKIFPGQQSETLELGQKEESVYPESPNRYSQAGQTLYHSAQSSHFQVGQREESSNLELGQKEESFDEKPQGGRLELGQREESFEIGQREESLHQNPQSEHLEVGQKEDSLEVGQKEENFYQNSQVGNVDLGQREENDGLEVGQKEESLYQNPQSVHVDLGQREESLYQIPHSSNLNLGQSSSLEIGQREESLYQNPQSEHLEVGQKEYSSSLEVGQKEESLYQNPRGDNPDLGQREESLHQNPQSEYLELGQKEDSSSLEVGQKEESLYQNSQVGNVDLGQREENYGLEVGQKEESLYQNPHSVNVDLGQREESFNLEVGQRQENVQGNSHLGQEEMSLSGQHLSEDIGQREENIHESPHSGQLELGQREEPILVPIRKQQVYRREESVHHAAVPSRNFVLGQQQGTITNVGKTGNTRELDLGATHPHGQYNGYSSQKETICQHYSHGVNGQRGHSLEEHGGKVSSQFHNKEEGEVVKKLVSEHSFTEKRQEEMGNVGVTYHVRRYNLTTSDAPRRPTVETQEENIKSTTQKESNIAPQSIRKPSNGGEINLNKKIDDLLLELELEGIMKKPSSNPIEDSSTSVESKKIQEVTPRTASTEVHTAEIQELGFEDFNKKINSEVNISGGAPERTANVYETHREEFSLNPPVRKTYSKKHSRQYTRTSISDGSVGVQPVTEIERYTEYKPLQNAGQTSGSSYSYSQRGYSSQSGGGYFNDQPVQRQHISRTEFLGSNQEGNKHATIDEFLKELDKDIARSGAKRTQSGYVQVTSQQQPSSSGTSYYSEKSYSSHSSHGTSSSSGSGDRSWFQKVGDSLGSSYNKAVDKIGTSYNQAKEKAKEIVDSVKQKVSYYQ